MINNKIFYSGVVAACLSASCGCGGNSGNVDQSKPTDYFASVPVHYYHGMSLNNGDFDGDGDLDLIVGGFNDSEGRLYYFENDGKGKFSLRK